MKKRCAPPAHECRPVSPGFTSMTTVVRVDAPGMTIAPGYDMDGITRQLTELGEPAFCAVPTMTHEGQAFRGARLVVEQPDLNLAPRFRHDGV